MLFAMFNNSILQNVLLTNNIQFNLCALSSHKCTARTNNKQTSRGVNVVDKSLVVLLLILPLSLSISLYFSFSVRERKWKTPQWRWKKNFNKKNRCTHSKILVVKKQLYLIARFIYREILPKAHTHTHTLGWQFENYLHMYMMKILHGIIEIYYYEWSKKERKKCLCQLVKSVLMCMLAASSLVLSWLLHCTINLFNPIK